MSGQLRALVAIAALLSLNFAESTLAQSPAPGSLKPISCPQPAYPKAPLLLNQEGSVVLHFSLVQDGSPRDITVTTSSGVAELDGAGITALQSCKFDTAGLDSLGLMARNSIRYSFTIPQKISCPSLNYPEIALTAKQEGVTKLNVRVDPEGIAIGFEILKSSGVKTLDDAAVSNAMSCKFPKSEKNERKWVEREYVFRLDLVRNQPNPTQIGKCAPEYPARSLRNGEEGRVTLEFRLRADGTVKTINVAETSGYRRLDSEAEAALWVCKFDWQGYPPTDRKFRMSFSFKIGSGVGGPQQICDGDSNFIQTQGYICNQSR